MDHQTTCPRCGARIGVMDIQVGHPVRCPHCRELFAPALEPATFSGGVTKSTGFTGALFTFTCQQCRSRLEGYTGMVGRTGQCPTCGVQFTIPAPGATVQRTGGTAPETESIQPTHAFASAGDRAPEIVRLSDGQQAICCPRCEAVNDLDADNCSRCAAPFTLEGSEPQTGGRLPTASLIMGVIGLPACPAFVPAVLAIVFGLMAIRETRRTQAPGRGRAIAGLILGAVGIVAGVLFYA